MFMDKLECIMSGDADTGFGCIVIFVVLCIVGGGFWQGVALVGVGWFGYLVIVGVSLGIVAAFVKWFAG